MEMNTGGKRGKEIQRNGLYGLKSDIIITDDVCSVLTNKRWEIEIYCGYAGLM